MAMLRCSTRESDGKANLHQGAVGVGIDMASGKSLSSVQHGTPITHHPDTGYYFSAALKYHTGRKYSPLQHHAMKSPTWGYLGVDIVLDKNLGPLILETQCASRVGHTDRQ